MPASTIKPPGAAPLGWFNALAAACRGPFHGPGEWHTLGMREDHAAARVLLRRAQAWGQALRAHPHEWGDVARMMQTHRLRFCIQTPRPAGLAAYRVCLRWEISPIGAVMRHAGTILLKNSPG